MTTVRLAKRSRGIAFAVSLSLSVSGCASVLATSGVGSSGPCDPGPDIYGGVASDAVLIYSVFVPDTSFGVAGRVGLLAFALADLPFSAVLDTLFLPVTVPREIVHFRQCRASGRADRDDAPAGDTEGPSIGPGRVPSAHPDAKQGSDSTEFWRE